MSANADTFATREREREPAAAVETRGPRRKQGLSLSWPQSQGAGGTQIPYLLSMGAIYIVVQIGSCTRVWHSTGYSVG